MDVPHQALHNLKCSLCHHYLSIVPTYRQLSTDKLFCGLCTPKEDKILEMPYEMVSSHLYFPCKYENLGCRKKCRTCEMKRHEMFCSFANFLCPLNCKWQRPMSEMLYHYRDKHNSQLIIENQDFKVSGDIPMYLVLGREGLFLMKISILKQQKMLLSIIELSESTNKNYCFKFFTGINQDILGTYNIPEDQIITFNVNKITINDFFTITITNTGLKVHRLLKENMQLLNALVCSKCRNLMSAPIYQNNKSDNICKNCIVECKSETNQRTRNYILENICEKVIYPCKSFDCNFLLKSSEKDNHEIFCKYSRIVCPNFGCIRRMQKYNLMNHLRKSHRKQVIDLNIIKFDYTEAAIYDYVYLERHESVFRITHRFLKCRFLFAVECIDEFKKYERYIFTIRISNCMGNEIVLRQMCSNYEFKEFDFVNNTNDNFVELPLNMIKPFIVNKRLKYFIHIDKMM